MADPIREKARKILDDNVPGYKEIRSIGDTAATFERITGLNQTKLTDAWTTGKNLTSCNAFSGWFSRQLGCDKYLGFFDMEKELTKMGREMAYVDARSGARPKCGDIFRAKSFHVGVTYDCTGDFVTVEGGQGGKLMGCDVVKRKTRPYNADNLIGWIDIELFMAAQKAFALVPEHMTGWWKVDDGAASEYWWFGSAVQNKHAYFKNVLRTAQQPASLSDGPGESAEKGQYVMDGGGALTVSWKGKPVGEKFRQVLSSAQPKMAGFRKGMPLTAVKMEEAGAAGFAAGQAAVASGFIAN